MHKYFTIQEANAALAFVKPVMKEVHQLWKELKVLREHAQSLDENELRERLERLEYCLQELKQVGCICKDLEHALIDFPSFYKDQEVELCWQLGEDEVLHWHSAGDGFQGRQALTEDFIAHNSKEPQLQVEAV